MATKYSLLDLLKLNVLTVDVEINMKSSSGQVVAATITHEGKIKLVSGEEFPSPSAAARFLRNGISSNGWRTWSLAETGRPLGSLRP